MTRLEAALIAFLVAALAIFVLRPVAEAAGLLDRPGGRKHHQGSVPLIGGLCMYLALLIALPLLTPNIYGQTPLLIAATLLVVVGAIDDRFELPPRVRLVAQATVGMIIVLGADLEARSLGNIFFMGDVNLGLLSLPFTLLVVLTVVNAFNFLDGMDGLTGGVAFSSFLTAAIAASVASSDTGLSLACIGIAIIAGFLIFNFPTTRNREVRVFMGDAGATLLGFLVVWLGLRISNGPDAFLPAVVALWLAALPVSDFFNCFVRRVRRGQSPMQPDCEHLHHHLRRAGLTDRQIMLTLTLVSLTLGLGAVLAHHAGVPDGLLFIAFLGLCLSQNWVVRRLPAFGSSRAAAQKATINN